MLQELFGRSDDAEVLKARVDALEAYGVGLSRLKAAAVERQEHLKDEHMRIDAELREQLTSLGFDAFAPGAVPRPEGWGGYLKNVRIQSCRADNQAAAALVEQIIPAALQGVATAVHQARVKLGQLRLADRRTGTT